MIYTFALWIANSEKKTRVSMYRETSARNERNAYKNIIEDAYKYYMHRGDTLDKVVLIEYK